MGHWTDIARWIGPSPNRTTGGMVADVRGVVVHIASGSFDGTIAWQHNPDAGVSSHFIVSRAGEIVQMVDTSDGSWAQKAGNRTWLSIENEGRTPGDVGYKPGLERLTDAQIDANARILLKTHQIYGTKVPLQLATSPSGRGLGHHSMGAESGADWGHSACPGTVIKAQKPAILARAVQLAGGASPTATTGANDMGTLEGDQARRLNNIDEIGWQAIVNGSPVAKGLVIPGQATVDRPVWLTAKVTELAADVKASRVAIEAMAAAINNGGGSVDSAGIIAHMDQLAAAETAREQDMLARIAELEAELEQARHAQHDAAQAEADATADAA